MIDGMDAAAMRDRARRLREHAISLRRIADDLNRDANALEALTSDQPLLGGRDLADAAVQVLANRGVPLHYRDLVEAVERFTGRQVRGADPAATLLAAIDRDERIAGVGLRTGRYWLVD